MPGMNPHSMLNHIRNSEIKNISLSNSFAAGCENLDHLQLAVSLARSSHV